jgi:hypothetical protein
MYKEIVVDTFAPFSFIEKETSYVNGETRCGS